VCGHSSSNWHHRNSNKSFKDESANRIKKKHSKDSLQKTAILGTSQVIWKVLPERFKRRSTKEKRPATRDNIIATTTTTTTTTTTH
jgi:hypothetical protein